MSVDPTEQECLAQWGYVLGLWHDLGKFAPQWQRYLARKAGADLEREEVGGVVDHSTAGSQHALAREPMLGWLLAFAIQGHHAGLPNAVAGEAAAEARLRKEVYAFAQAPKALLEWPVPGLPRSIRSAVARRDAVAVAGYVRRLFSCLVDADFLATEAFMQPEQRVARGGGEEGVLERMEALLAAKVRQFGEA